jgi:hypothetical protein
MGKRWASKFLTRPHCDSTRRLDGPGIAPNPTAGTGKRISYLYDSTNSYISFLNNSSLSDPTPFQMDLLLTEAEVVDQIEDAQEVEMEVQEV